eukprot:355468-Chlamydomonas_euryale.AAC.5
MAPRARWPNASWLFHCHTVRVVQIGRQPCKGASIARQFCYATATFLSQAAAAGCHGPGRHLLRVLAH